MVTGDEAPTWNSRVAEVVESTTASSSQKT